MIETVGVVGLGLIGGSIAEAIRAATGHMFRNLPIRPEDVALAGFEE